MRLALVLILGLAWSLPGLIGSWVPREAGVTGLLMALSLWPLTGIARGQQAARVAMTSGLIFCLLIANVHDPEAGYRDGIPYGLTIGLVAGLIYWLLSRYVQAEFAQGPDRTGVAARVRQQLGSPPMCTAVASAASVVLSVTLLARSMTGMAPLVAFFEMLLPTVAFGILLWAFARLGMLTERIRVVEALSWSWARLAKGFGLSMLPIVLWIVFTSITSSENRPVDHHGHQHDAGELFALTMMIGAPISLLFGLAPRDIPRKFYPNQGIWRSANSALRVGLIGGLLPGLLFLGTALSAPAGGEFFLRLNQTLAILLWLGVPLGLFFGGFTCLQHLVLRLLLVRQGVMPWDYVRFLEYATERILLRKAGGAYLFVHRLLLEDFARARPLPEAPAAEQTLELQGLP